MIKTEIISSNVLKILVPDKITADDIRQIAPQVETIINQYGKIRLLIDASGFNGWENIVA
ncbi:MAG: STAS/SEC14 domain-containing protein, partial [Xanthobacteraceae bacterium]